MSNTYIKAYNHIRKDISTNCGGHSYYIYITLLSHLNKQTYHCFPSRKILSEETGLCIRVLDKYIDLLEKHGFIIKRSGTLGRSTQYYFPREKDINYSEEDMAYMGILKDQANKKREEKKKKLIKEVINT